MGENEVARVIIDTAYQINSQIGPGLFESVYEEIMEHELIEKGLKVERQKSIGIKWKNLVIPNAFKADLIVEERVIVELKAVETILPVHKRQVITYLKLSELKLGILINFNVELITKGITRLVNNLPEKKSG